MVVIFQILRDGPSQPETSLDSSRDQARDRTRARCEDRVAMHCLVTVLKILTV